MEQADLEEQFAKDVLLLRLVGIRPVIVHGGGPQIGALMKRLGKEPRFVGGMRVTDEETMEIVEMVLVGKINKEIVGLINLHGGRAVGLSGKDGSLIRAHKRLHRTADGTMADIGLVGEVDAVNPELIRLLEVDGFIPVIAPVGVGSGGETYNINADLVAGDVAAALSAEKLIHLTDVQGIKGEDGRHISTLTKQEAERLIKAGVIDGGMLPKVESSLRALAGGAQKAPSSTGASRTRPPRGAHGGRHRHRDHPVAGRIRRMRAPAARARWERGTRGHQATDGVVGQAHHGHRQAQSGRAGAR